jgi:cytochrome c peroxidase
MQRIIYSVKKIDPRQLGEEATENILNHYAANGFRLRDRLGHMHYFEKTLDGEDFLACADCPKFSAERSYCDKHHYSVLASNQVCPNFFELRSLERPGEQPGSL